MTAQIPRILPYGEAAIAEAAALIHAGGIVAVPTETVYGLAADATDDFISFERSTSFSSSIASSSSSTSSSAAEIISSLRFSSL